jgi:hypothetical protein
MTPPTRPCPSVHASVPRVVALNRTEARAIITDRIKATGCRCLRTAWLPLLASVYDGADVPMSFRSDCPVHGCVRKPAP